MRYKVKHLWFYINIIQYLILAADLQIVARQNCSEKTIVVKNIYNSQLIFITKSDDVAATAVGVTY